MFEPLLYIPHGSDERYWEIILLLTTIASLYPTWFRWKFPRLQFRKTMFLPLYPTWFRWKKVAKVQNSSFTALYIPHGSDERKRICRGWRDAKHFISHMVQMKEKVESRKLKVESKLYIPHGSDESMANATIKLSGAELYIPHGSDESSCLCYRFLFRWSTLYPTWFRWKWLYVRGLSLFTPLYIPHGSDESKSCVSMRNLLTCLYIPHGSDER